MLISLEAKKIYNDNGLDFVVDNNIIFRIMAHYIGVNEGVLTIMLE